MLYPMDKILTVARQERFAVGAFNVSTAELLRAVIAAAERTASPVILAIHPDELAFAGESFVGMCREVALSASVPVAIHLDHGTKIEQLLRALKCGFTSVMIDASTLPFEENIRITREVVKLAHSVGVSVEGELGTIGQATNTFEQGHEVPLYTDPAQAEEFVRQTGVDALAVAIGTAHGLYPRNLRPKLQLDRLKAIAKRVDRPLVLHGGSDNSEEEIRQAITYGIAKINISSDLKRAFYVKMREVLAREPEAFEPLTLLPEAIEAAIDLVIHKMELFGSVGKGRHIR